MNALVRWAGRYTGMGTKALLGALGLGVLYVLGKSFARRAGTAVGTLIMGNGTLGNSEDLGDLGGSANILSQAIAFIDEAARETAGQPKVSEQISKIAQLAREGKLWEPNTPDVTILLQTHSLVGAAPHTRAKVELYMAQRGVTSKGGGQVATAQDLELAKQAVASTPDATPLWRRPVVWVAGGAGLLLLLSLGGLIYFRRRAAA